MTVDLFVVVEDTVAPERPCANYVPVGQNISASSWLVYAKQFDDFRQCQRLRTTYPRLESTTNPVASLVKAWSVSKEQVWQNRIATTFRTTFWIVLCHSPELPGVPTNIAAVACMSSPRTGSPSYSTASSMSGVLSPGDSFPLTARLAGGVFVGEKPAFLLPLDETVVPFMLGRSFMVLLDSHDTDRIARNPGEGRW